MADQEEREEFFFDGGDGASNLAANEDPHDDAANQARVPGVNSLGGNGSQARTPPSWGIVRTGRGQKYHPGWYFGPFANLLTPTVQFHELVIIPYYVSS